jgi:hypothetical protein
MQKHLHENACRLFDPLDAAVSKVFPFLIGGAGRVASRVMDISFH